MLTLLSEKTRMAREDAYALMSLACDLHISQMVNGPCGVHAMIPKAVLPE
jgi:acetamidase/formamidase